MEREPCVYILAKASHSTFYTGVTSSLVQRIYQHRNDYFRGFAKRYAIKRLVGFERHATMDKAILREKQIKRWRRQWKYDLVNAMNPHGAISPRTLGSRRCQQGRRIPGQARDDELGKRPPSSHSSR